jgi:hypothetical protein
MQRQLREIDSGDGHWGNGAINIPGKLNHRPVILGTVYLVIYDDGVPMRYDYPLQEKPKSLQSTFVFVTFSLTDGERNRIADRRIHDHRIGVHHVHVGKNMALIY